MPKTEYLQGALDLLILKTLALGPNHGWGIQQRIRQVSRETLTVSQGSLYPALHRLEAAGIVASEMATSENNRKARVYQLNGGGPPAAERGDCRLAALLARDSAIARAGLTAPDVRRHDDAVLDSDALARSLAATTGWA